MNDPNTSQNDNSKAVAIVCHITLLGWIIAIIMNSQNRSELGSFYLRQTLGIFLMTFLAIIPFVGWLIAIFGFILWIISLINAINGNMTPVPGVGEMFQNWFRGM